MMNGTQVVVGGVGMTHFGKFNDRSVRSLAEEAVRGALEDAGIGAKDVQAAFFSNAVSGLLTGQEMIRGQVALRHTGLLGIPLFNVENACASASSAFHLAWMSVASGMYDVALAVGAEKLTHEDKTLSFRAIGTAVDLEQLRQLQKQISEGGGSSPEGESKKGKENRSFFMDIYASTTRNYMKASGATAETFADVVVKAHDHASLNPKAQYRNKVTREEVLESRTVSPPLTLLMCSPIGDGAAAAVVVSAKKARELGISKPVQVRASVLVSGTDRKEDEPDAVERSAKQAYEKSGIDPKDVQVVEVHDAAAPAELIATEDLHLCGRGEGAALLESGRTHLGGAGPVINPSGGLVCKGHPIGATGIAQIAEIVDQLRGRCGERQVEGAKVGLTENGGGFLGLDAAAMSVHVFTV